MNNEKSKSKSKWIQQVHQINKDLFKKNIGSPLSFICHLQNLCTCFGGEIILVSMQIYFWRILAKDEKTCLNLFSFHQKNNYWYGFKVCFIEYFFLLHLPHYLWLGAKKKVGYIWVPDILIDDWVHKGHTKLNMFPVFVEQNKSLCSKQSKFNIWIWPHLKSGIFFCWKERVIWGRLPGPSLGFLLVCL